VCGSCKRGNKKGPDVRQRLLQAHYPRQLIERLERVTRIMNPLLFFVALSLVVLNLACVVNLIDWRDAPQAAKGSAGGSFAAASSGTVRPTSTAPAVEPGRGALAPRN
jgi:hypothetical protein